MTTPLDLLDNLDKWRKRAQKPEIISFRSKLPRINKTLRLCFETLHAYHTRLPTLQTHKSFRVLVEIVIKEGSKGDVE